MSLRSTDALFARYCRTGDGKALGIVFDRTAPELLRIAGWLCGNRADAEDLLQRTFLLAIEARAEFDRRQRALPWLCGILTNQARNLARDKARRAVLVTDGNAVRRPEQAAQDAEFAAAVAAARQELQSPYREVLELHLEQGLQCKEIAVQLGRPAGTVRTQLVRALELLRRRLPSGFVAGAAAATLPDAARLAAVRTAVLTHGKVQVPLAFGSAGTIATAATLTGAGIMAKKLLVAFAVLLLLSLGIYTAWPSAAADPPSPTDAPALVAADPGGAHETAADTQLAAPLARQPSPAADSDPGFASVHVAVRWADDHSPAAGVGVSALDAVALMPSLRRRALTDANGMADLPHLQPGGWWVRTSHEISMPPRLELRADQRECIELLAQRTCTAHGQVLDPEGRPVAGAQVWSSPSGASGETYLATTSDAGGNFTLPLVKSHALCARKDGFESSYLQWITVADGRSPDIALQLRARGGSLRGRVVDSRGAPIRWTKVQIGEVQVWSSVSHTYPIGEEIVTGTDGVFVAHGLGTEPTDVQAWAAGHCFWRQTIQVAIGEQRELTIVLADGATVHGVVRDDAGDPVTGASVGFGDRFRDFACARVLSDAGGRFAIGDLPAGDFELRAGKGDLRAVATLQLRAGERSEWNPVLGKGRTIRGSVVDENNRPVAGIEVGRVEPPYGDPLRWTKTGDDGRFEVTNVGDQPIELVVRKNRTPLRRLRAVLPDTDDLVVALSTGDEPSAFLRGRVLDARNAPVAARVMAHPRTPRSSMGSAVPTDPATGAFTCGPLFADTYDIVVSAKDLGAVSLGAVTLAPWQDLALGDVVLQPAGSARFLLLDTAGKRVDSIVRIYDHGGHEIAQHLLEGGREPEQTLQPGHFTAVGGLTGLDASAEFEVQSAQHVDVTLQGVPAAAVQLCVQGLSPGQSAQVLVRRADGAPACARTLSESSPKATVLLRPGSYRVDCLTSDGRKGTTELVVRGSDERPEVTIALPER